MKPSGNLRTLTDGIIRENPVLVTLLGTCPTLAVTLSAVNGIGMGLATTFVLICSNVVISLLKRFIPSSVRLPSFIIIIAGFVTVVGFLMEGYAPALYDSLGVFLSLITVNCIILGRAEAFASKNKVLPSLLDGLGRGIGFTLALLVMGGIRELLGAGTLFGIPVTKDFIEPMRIFISPPGGFFVFAILIACVNYLIRRMGKRKPLEEMGCSGCPASGACHAACDKKSTDEEENMQ